MKQILYALMTTGLTVFSGLPVTAQSAQQQGISNSTQILDTSVLFAIGAREADQAIRGSFGWPTFQEGFVDRVYYRFDPDGYARFSTSPRLDEDVFEVICAESSTACLAKKPNIEIGLTPAGQIQIKISGITPQDSFHVSDRKSELPLPPTVLEPLDARLETLLASSTDLIIKREVEVIQKISLSGFSAVVTYLRWVAQKQNSRVFPRGWPAPSQGVEPQLGGLTQPDLWDSPNSGPQNVGGVFNQQNPSQNFNQGGANNPQTNFAPNTQSMIISGDRIENQPRDGQLSQTGSLEAQILDLQRQIGQIQEGPAQQEDLKQGFAEQAMGRSLHTPIGFNTVSELSLDPNSVWNQQQKSARANANDMRGAQVSQQMGIDLQNQLLSMHLKLETIEQIVIANLNELNFEIENLRHLMTTKNDSANEQVSATNAISPSSEINSNADEIEKLLLEQLKNTEIVANSNMSNVVDGAPNIDISQNDLIEKLLKQLSEDQTAELDAEQADVAPQKQAAGEGFVTLSDYINQVFKAEGNKSE